MPQLKLAHDMCIFLLASFFMTLEVLACFSDSECFYPFFVLLVMLSIFCNLSTIHNLATYAY